MVRRWIIRSLFLLPLVCAVGVWVDSYSHQVDVAYTGSRTVLLITARGMIRGYWFEKPFVTAGYSAGFEARRFESAVGFEDRDYLGFALARVEQYDPFTEPFLGAGRTVVNRYWDAGAPFWFLTLVLAALNWFVWRKTRAKYSWQAFPVEPSAKPGESNP